MVADMRDGQDAQRIWVFLLSQFSSRGAMNAEERESV